MPHDEQLSQRLHPASLLPICTHNPLLLQLLAQRPSMEMVDYIAREAIQSIQIQGDSPAERLRLREFIIKLVHYAHVNVATLLTTLIYFDRLRMKLENVQGNIDTRRRVFLATLIVGSKYLNDSAPRNSHWEKYAAVFSMEEINLMERQLLALLNYDLRFDEEEACRYFAPFMAICAQQVSTRAIAVDKVTKASIARAQALAEAKAQVQAPSKVASLQPLPRERHSPVSSALAHAVREVVERPSNPHLSSARRETLAPPAMQRSRSSDSTNSSAYSSDIASLIDDTGSSSGSSSGWMTSDSESDSEEEHRVEPRVYSDSSLNNYSDERLPHIQDRKSFIVRPIPSYALKNNQLQNRARKPSDSSVRTVTAPSPTNSSSFSPLSSHSRRSSSKRAASISVSNAGNDRENPLSSSATMPSIPRSGLSGNFLTRMWGAAKAQATGHGHDKSAGADGDAHLPSALRRLVLAPSRSGIPKNSRTSPMGV
ncbi:PHO85 cyclin-1 [Paramarasmius palmivorus]|uniref:PHO85 cyclin-1 n=1 Tax=Paramarasmius palmivorus TaxID=297713 RepID=A0AAW0DJ97_9AGAR